MVRTANVSDLIKLIRSPAGLTVTHKRDMAKAILYFLTAIKDSSIANNPLVKSFTSSGTDMRSFLEKTGVKHNFEELFIPKASENISERLSSVRSQASAGNTKHPIVETTSSGKLVVASGTEVKLMGQGADLSLFSNFPCDYQDKVWLNINKQDLLFLYTHTEEHKEARDFFAHCCDNFDGQRVNVPYVVAFFGIKELLSFCSKQYRSMEALSNDLAIADSGADSQGVKPLSSTEEKAKLCFSDMNLLMNICVALEDQLWAMV